MIRKYFLIHLSAILDGRIFILMNNGIIEGFPLIAEEDFKNVPEDIKKKTGRIKILTGDVFNIARKIKCKVFICNDKKTELRLKTEGVNVIDLASLSVLCRRPLKIGEIVEIETDTQKSGIFLEDGTEVVIEGNTVSGKIKCRINGILETVDFRKIYCEIT